MSGPVGYSMRIDVSGVPEMLSKVRAEFARALRESAEDVDPDADPRQVLLEVAERFDP